MIFLSLLVFLLVFSFLVIIHECGHFFAAKWSGVKVLEFGLGLGKKIWGKKKGETEFTVNAIPFGGFVRMLGEEESSDDPRSFEKAKLWKRMTITLAGVFMNFVFAILALTILFSIGTQPFLISQADIVKAKESGVLTIVEQEDGTTLVDLQEIQKPLHQAFPFAVKETFRISRSILQKLGELPAEIREKKGIPEEIKGPLGIWDIIYQIIPQGFEVIFRIAILLSISLGVMNLLPIPALDGGRFLFQLWEMITRRPASIQAENLIHFIGFILLMAMILIITWSDIANSDVIRSGIQSIKALF